MTVLQMDNVLIVVDVQYADSHRLSYVRDPEGIMVALAESLAPKAG